MYKYIHILKIESLNTRQRDNENEHSILIKDHEKWIFQSKHLCGNLMLIWGITLSFTSNNHLSQNAFNLIHYDTWDLYHVSTQSGHRYFLTLVDDCTRFT